MERRDFLRTAFGAAAAGVLLPRLAAGEWSTTRADGSLGPIGLQLYTVRTEMAKDVDSTLATVAGIGYKEVEFAGLFGHPAKDVRAMLNHHGLVAPSSHVAFPRDAKAWPGIIADAHTLGQSYVVSPSLPDNDLTPDGVKRIADEFNAAGAILKKAGLRFAFHNHDTVFHAVDGHVPYDLLLAECDPALVAFEVDIYWMVNGGGDPLAYVAKYPGRFPMVHAKDRTADGKMADVGKGVLDFPKILAAFKRAGLQHCFVEHDHPAHPFASARDSFDYLNALTF